MQIDTKVIINPLAIPEKDLPLIVLTDNLWSWISWGIREHTHGVYTHIGIMVHPLKFASQRLTFKEEYLQDYLSLRHRLKFFKFECSDEVRKRIITAVENELALPWWKKTYDFLGVFGQKCNIPAIQLPFAHYCTERISHYIRLVEPVKEQASPTEINEQMTLSHNFSYYGHWFMD